MTTEFPPNLRTLETCLSCRHSSLIDHPSGAWHIECTKYPDAHTYVYWVCDDYELIPDDPFLTQGDYIR